MQEKGTAEYPGTGDPGQARGAMMSGSPGTTGWGAEPGRSPSPGSLPAPCSWDAVTKIWLKRPFTAAGSQAKPLSYEQVSSQFPLGVRSE